MPSRPHVDILDTDEELARLRKRKPTAQKRVPATKERNQLVDRYRWVRNVLLRIYRGTTEDNGWRDGDFTESFNVGRVSFRPSSIAGAAALHDRLANGLWAAYLLEYVENVEAIGSDKEKSLIREPLEAGGFRQTDGRDWTKADEARRLFAELGLPEADFRARLLTIRKPVAVNVPARSSR